MNNEMLKVAISATLVLTLLLIILFVTNNPIDTDSFINIWLDASPDGKLLFIGLVVVGLANWL